MGGKIIAAGLTIGISLSSIGLLRPGTIQLAKLAEEASKKRVSMHKLNRSLVRNGEKKVKRKIDSSESGANLPF